MNSRHPRRVSTLERDQSGRRHTGGSETREVCVRSRIVAVGAVTTAVLLLVAGCAATPTTPKAIPHATAAGPPLPTELYLRAESATAQALDRNAHAISTIGFDGVVLSPTGDTVSDLSARAPDLVAAAHAKGLTAELRVSNFDIVQGEFSQKSATALLGNVDHRATVTAALAARVALGDFDGVQIDFESLGATDAAGLFAFTKELRDALGAPKVVSMAVPAASSAARYREAGYDFTQLAPLLSRTVLKAYDQHAPTRSKAGPVGGLPWATTALDALISTGMPSAHIDLGVAGFGYSWPGNGSVGKQLSDNGSRMLAGDLARWDSTQAEWTATLPDDTVVWWSDARSLAARQDLARSRNIHGIAVWEAALTDPL